MAIGGKLTNRVSLCIAAAVFAFVAAALAACFPLFATDTACRYAPMAEAFAEGNWSEAFHPRFGVGFPVIAGLIRFVMVTGVSKFTKLSKAKTIIILEILNARLQMQTMFFISLMM